MLFILTLAAALSAPQLDARFAVGAQEAMRREATGTITVQLGYWIDPRGVVYKCEVRRQSEQKANVAAGCERIIARELRLKRPAIDREGNPAFGYLESTIVQRRLEAGSDGLPFMPDLALDVSALPSGLESPLVIWLTVMADATGRVISCEPSSEGNRQLSEVACQQVSKIDLPRGSNAEGVPISYVREISVAFLVPKTR